jgi:hypothetical protein
LDSVAKQLGWNGRQRSARTDPDGTWHAGGFDRWELTRSQRSSILRAIHRVIDGQPGWVRECRRRSPEREYSNVTFEFMPAERHTMSQNKRVRLATKSVVQRPLSQRQQAKDRAARRRGL